MEQVFKEFARRLIERIFNMSPRRRHSGEALESARTKPLPEASVSTSPELVANHGPQSLAEMILHLACDGEEDTLTPQERRERCEKFLGLRPGELSAGAISARKQIEKQAGAKSFAELTAAMEASVKK